MKKKKTPKKANLLPAKGKSTFKTFLVATSKKDLKN